MTEHGVTALRPVTVEQRRCPAKRVTWPTWQCELIAGHDGDHVAHGDTRQQLFTWRTGRER